MNSTETWDLYETGREDWNNWAEALLEERKGLINDGQWAFNWDDWSARAEANFAPEGSDEFDEDAEFYGFVFPGKAVFNNCIFKKDANFNTAVFMDDAEFTDVDFKGDALFNEVEFKGKAQFSNATFENLSTFNRASFAGHARFENSEFKGFASFNAIYVSSLFNLREAQFNHIPHFVQATFNEPPRLDNLNFKACLPKRSHEFDPGEDPRAKLFRWCKVAESEDDFAHWMALRKIAQNSQNHVLSMDFFARELRSRRFWGDMPVGKGWGGFWFGAFYQIFSDFGRSFFRPLFVWVSCILLLFFALTIGRNFMGCDPWQGKYLETVFIAVSNSFPGFELFHGGSDSATLQQLFCLDKTTILPKWDIALLIYSLWQTSMVFLFLLAVRNRFRIG